MAIARGIIEAHKGRIWVESVLRRGSTFFFTLPVWHGAVPDTAPAETRVSPVTTPAAVEIQRPPEPRRGEP